MDIDLVTDIARALGLDQAQVARWRQACQDCHAPPAMVVNASRHLPADLDIFTGRHDELA